MNIIYVVILGYVMFKINRGFNMLEKDTIEDYSDR